MAPQFSDFRKVRKRIRRTLGYGMRQPYSINLPLSELVVDFFNKRSPFDYLKSETSACISGCGYADPCTLVVAMVYLDRLRLKDKNWFESSDPSDLYLPALVIASKFLHDSDTYDRASNSEWAEAANISNKHLSQLEWDFVRKINWNLMVDDVEFNNWLSFFEFWVANDFVIKNNFCTYNELIQLCATLPLASTLQRLVSFFVLIVVAYSVLVVFFFVIPCSVASLGIRHAENITVKQASVILHGGLTEFPSALESEVERCEKSVVSIRNSTVLISENKKTFYPSKWISSSEILILETCIDNHSVAYCARTGQNIPGLSAISFL
ncbi:Cyclin [Dictyocaulus viviparus]|uniref:Protein CNPPD1 n=1 Tax=Dictyocaulus viviparus TaxID=29172 RepID=A0A0D8XFB0_DICVI|nr:Cyclin [Dictyocaulus viviparus]